MNVKTAARILDILETFARVKKPLTVSEIASMLEIPVSSCFALVKTLENRGYISSLSTRYKMYPTKKLYKLTLEINQYDLIPVFLQEKLKDLNSLIGETVILSKLQHNSVIYIDVYDSQHSIRYNANIGDRKNLFHSSGGKAFLSLLSDQELKKKLTEFNPEALTPNTIAAAEVLYQNIVNSKNTKGWFTNLGETVVDLAGIATVINVEETNYAVSIVGPYQRITPNLELIGNHLLSFKEDILQPS